MTGSVPPGLLVQPAQLSRYNVPSAFLTQFALKPFTLVVSVGGVLGVMQFTWLYAGDSYQSAPFQSVAGATWAYTLEDTFSDLVFAARTYVLGETYVVDSNGAVTGAVGLTATRFSLVQNACSAATAEAMTLMRDAVRAPLTAWGDDAVTHCAAMVYGILKRGRGATPDAAGGDGDNNIFIFEKRALQFFGDIGKNGRPESMTDTSSTADGPLIAAYPISNTLRGW